MHIYTQKENIPQESTREDSQGSGAEGHPARSVSILELWAHSERRGAWGKGFITDLLTEDFKNSSGFLHRPESEAADCTYYSEYVLPLGLLSLGGLV